MRVRVRVRVRPCPSGPAGGDVQDERRGEGETGSVTGEAVLAALLEALGPRLAWVRVLAAAGVR